MGMQQRAPIRRQPIAARAGDDRVPGGGGGLDTRVLQTALRDPVSFFGGVFAGLLALDLKQEPLRSWVEDTAAEAGLKYQATVDRLEQERKARGSS